MANLAAIHSYGVMWIWWPKSGEGVGSIWHRGWLSRDFLSGNALCISSVADSGQLVVRQVFMPDEERQRQRQPSADR